MTKREWTEARSDFWWKVVFWLCGISIALFVLGVVLKIVGADL